jgi:hypothetical protein
VVALSVFTPPNLYTRDLNQLFVASEALKLGESPYQKVPQLTERFFGFKAYGNNPHPIPYPPVAILAVSPFTNSDPVHFALFWLVLSVFATLLAVALLFSWLQLQMRPIAILIITSLILMSNAGFLDLFYGQNGLLLFCGLALVFCLIERGKSPLAAVGVGTILALKFVTYPIVILYLVKGRVRELMFASGTFIFWNLVAAADMGLDPLLNYYLYVSSHVSDLWASYLYNSSVYSLPARVVAPTAFAPDGPILTPLTSPVLKGLGWFITVLGLIVSIYRGLKDTEKICYARLSAFMSIGLPITWSHYQSFLFIPIACALTQWWNLSALARFFVGLTVSVIFLNWFSFAPFAPPEVLHGGAVPAPFPLLLMSSLQTLIPLVWALGPSSIYGGTREQISNFPGKETSTT